MADATGISQRMCESVAKTPVKVDGRIIPVSCSIGCAMYRNTDNADTLVQHADRALYRAKAGGRNRVEVDQANPE